MATRPPSFPPSSGRRRPDDVGARTPHSGQDRHPADPDQPPDAPGVPRESVSRRGFSDQRAPGEQAPPPGHRQHRERAPEQGAAQQDPAPPSYPPRDSAGTRGSRPGFPPIHPPREGGSAGSTRSAVPPSYAPMRQPASRGVQASSTRDGAPRSAASVSRSPQGSSRRLLPEGPTPSLPPRGGGPARGGRAPAPTLPTRRRRRRWRLPVAVALVLLICWPAFLMWDASRNLGRTDALSGTAPTPGTTYLLAGSDSRADGSVPDDTEGQRADSIMVVNVAPNGQTVSVSLPRDTYVEIPEYGWNKLNASYALGGAPLLVRTVEGLTGLTVDHYVEVGMGGMADIVDAVGGVNLCLDMDVDDPKSELVWTSGCHDADGKTALAFSRMRYSDPRGDIGRAERQRQVVSKTVSKAMSPSVLVNPVSALRLERAGAGALTVDRDTDALAIARLALAFRTAGNESMTGVPPIESMGYETEVGSAVLLRDETAPDFFLKLREGTLTQQDLALVP